MVLVSHHNFLQGLLATTARIENCTPIVCEVSPDGRATASEHHEHAGKQGGVRPVLEC